VIVIDEYLALDVLGGRWPDGLADDGQLGLPATHHYRLLQRVHQPGGGRLSAILGGLSDAGRYAVRRPHPDIIDVLDSRPLLDQAAQIAARYRTGGLLFTETLAAGLAPPGGLMSVPGPTLVAVSLTVHLSDELADRLAVEAARRGTGVEQTATELLAAALARPEPDTSPRSPRRRLAFAAIGASGSTRGAAQAAGRCAELHVGGTERCLLQRRGHRRVVCRSQVNRPRGGPGDGHDGHHDHGERAGAAPPQGTTHHPRPHPAIRTQTGHHPFLSTVPDRVGGHRA
jgi:plasmid stability protein